jgi:hypothetical protein
MLRIGALIGLHTAHNLLAVFGGVPSLSSFREGHVRSQGAFRHSILAGTFGATQVPLFVALWFCRPKYRRLALAATISGLIIVITANTSGGLLALLAGFGGLLFWRWRGYMRLVRWGTVITIFGLALVMKAPVWYLLARVSDVSGGGGWHRAWVIDQAVKHFNEWWLFGTTYTAHWGPGGEVIAADPNMMDITNQYVLEGVKGGVLKLALFLTIIVQCFKGVGRQLRAEWLEPQARLLIWALGVSLFTHCVGFFSICYFDQIIFVWYWLLAAITTVASTANERVRAAEFQNDAAAAAA